MIDVLLLSFNKPVIFRVKNKDEQQVALLTVAAFSTDNKELTVEGRSTRVFTVAVLFQSSRSTCFCLRLHLISRTSVTR